MKGHYANIALPRMSDDLPKQLKATFHRLDILLRRVFRLVSHFRRANFAIDVVLHNDIACLQEACHHLECLVEAAGD